MQREGETKADSDGGGGAGEEKGCHCVWMDTDWEIPRRFPAGYVTIHYTRHCITVYMSLLSNAA